MLNSSKEQSSAISLLNNLNIDSSKLVDKERKKITRKLKRQLKEIEYLKRIGGITIVIDDSTIITAYHNNSLDRKKILSKNKVIY